MHSSSLRAGMLRQCWALRRRFPRESGLATMSWVTWMYEIGQCGTATPRLGRVRDLRWLKSSPYVADAADGIGYHVRAFGVVILYVVDVADGVGTRFTGFRCRDYRRLKSRDGVHLLRTSRVAITICHRRGGWCTTCGLWAPGVVITMCRRRGGWCTPFTSFRCSHYYMSRRADGAFAGSQCFRRYMSHTQGICVAV